MQAAGARHAGEQELHLVGQDAPAAQDHVLVQAGHVGQVEQAHVGLLGQAAALAAVREYANGNPSYDSDTRDAAVQYAAANTAGVGQPLLPSVYVDSNLGNAASGDVVLGEITGAGPYTFDSNAPPTGCTPGLRLAVMVRTEHQVDSLILSTFLGRPVGTYYVQARAVAQYECSAGAPRLIQVSAYDPPF